MRSKLLILTTLIIASVAFAQTQAPAEPDNLYAIGGSYNSGAQPSVAGTAIYAHKMADAGTYAFTVIDALPISVKPFSVTTNVGAGISQKIFSVKNVPIFVPTGAGISFTGTNTGWSWNTGAMAAYRLKNGLLLLPNVRMVKSSVSNGAGYQVIAGFMFGWGQ